MHGSISLPGPVYIESRGVLVCRGRVQLVDPAVQDMVDVWPERPELGDRARLRALHYDGWGLHARETVELCRRILSRPGADVSLVYTHRGHRCQWKTPLLQSLLARLGPAVQAHGLQVQQDHLPLDVVLLGVATLVRCERCLIVKDNAVRVGDEEAVAVSTMPYLVLSRGRGPWAVQRILMSDSDPALRSPIPALSLDEFLADGDRGMDSLSLTSRTEAGCVGVIKVVRVGRNGVGSNSATGESSMVAETVVPGDPWTRSSGTYAGMGAWASERRGAGNA
jgi:hypothetical protein